MIRYFYIYHVLVVFIIHKVGKVIFVATMKYPIHDTS